MTLEGSLTLTNYRDKTVEVHVRRYVIGYCDEIGDGGEAKMQNLLELSPAVTAGAGVPSWWHMNGAVELSWVVPLDPGQPRELNYQWHYYYRP
ncbi:MAG: hypothetical protein BroJett003_11140 [Planctomycetota bacterium]|nr:MAG: hypothetical protein BroJett003_11140 [Planctomycetota bacterium]